MVYYGWVEGGIGTNPVYGILRNAPMRMPKEYKEGNYVYANSWEGKLSRFSGEERTAHGERLSSTKINPT